MKYNWNKCWLFEIDVEIARIQAALNDIQPLKMIPENEQSFKDATH
jgi:hypothetical protein